MMFKYSLAKQLILKKHIYIWNSKRKKASSLILILNNKITIELIIIANDVNVLSTLQT